MINEDKMRSDIEWRHETKLPIEERAIADIRAFFLSRGIKQTSRFPDRVVNSVYFDSLDFSDYRDNVAGISHRKKLRYRWYDDDLEDLCLEVKSKRGQISQKLRIKIDNDKVLSPTEYFNELTLRRHINLADFWSSFPTHRPVLAVSYRRAYFDLPSEVRVTYDRDIRYRRLFPVESAQVIRSPVGMVIEFKYPLDKATEVKGMLKGSPARVFRHSKYVVGMDTAFFS